jgi:hypothetical protein
MREFLRVSRSCACPPTTASEFGLGTLRSRQTWHYRHRMQLDDEQKNWIRGTLQRSGIPASASEVEQFSSAVSNSILVFERELNDAALPREAHDQLRAIWKLVVRSDPPIGQIRAKLRSLPAPAAAYLERRATRILPDPLAASGGSFIEWTRSAKASDLLAALRRVIAEGVQPIEGRRRANGRRSAPRLEPVIMGVARGSARGLSDGGRPRATAVDQLVMYLAVDWTLTTGIRPDPGRSDAEPFGELVHQVFSWIGLPGADQALRRYWGEVRSEAARPTRRTEA